MAYKVRFTLPERQLKRADIVFRVEHNGRRLGTLEVSQGALVWKRAYGRKGTYVRWGDLSRRLAGGG